MNPTETTRLPTSPRQPCVPAPWLIDIGGEGRHPRAWNVNPSSQKTLGPEKGTPIARHIPGRASELPFADGTAPQIIAERIPLTREALLEIARVIAPGGEIVLRMTPLPWCDRYSLAKQLLPGRWTERHGCIQGWPVIELRVQA